MIKDEETGLMRDMTPREARITEFFDDLRFNAGITAVETQHVSDLRKKDSMLDMFISALELKLEGYIK